MTFIEWVLLLGILLAPVGLSVNYTLGKPGEAVMCLSACMVVGALAFHEVMQRSVCAFFLLVGEGMQAAWFGFWSRVRAMIDYVRDAVLTHRHLTEMPLPASTLDRSLAKQRSYLGPALVLLGAYTFAFLLYFFPRYLA